MNEPIWFSAGALAASALAALLVRRRTRTAAAVAKALAARRRRALATVEAVMARYRTRLAAAEAHSRAEAATAAAVPAVPPAGAAGALQPAPLLHALGRELANIVSGVEGGAYLLIESSPLPPTRSPAAEALWLAVRRLRRFHDKVAASVAAPQPQLEPIPIDILLVGLREELEASELGLQMAWSLPRTLPRLRANHDALLCALLFLTHAQRQLEPGALRLSIHVEPCFADDPPILELELLLEYDEDPGRSPEPAPPSAGFHVARLAAENLLQSHGAAVELDHQPGHAVRALVRLPVDAVAEGTAFLAPEPVAPPAAGEELPLPPASRHDYGGVLVLESDPTVRSMVASELKASGRAVFACADGAAARSLMQATPDRFEMLVVDQASRLGATDALATTLARLCPEMKVFVLSDSSPGDLPPEIARRVRSLRKPFGLPELRRALASLLAD